MGNKKESGVLTFDLKKAKDGKVPAEFHDPVIGTVEFIMNASEAVDKTIVAS